MKLKPIGVDLDNITRSHLNERENQTVTEDSDLVQNIKNNGLNDFPLVHETGQFLGDNTPERYDDVEYACAVGWRRVLASRYVGDMDSISSKLIVGDDVAEYDVRMKSITDNIRSFSQETSIQQRAKAIKTAKEDGDKSNKDIAEDLGKARKTVSNWLEPYSWDEESVVNPKCDDIVAPKVSDNTTGVLKDTRQAVGGSDLGVKVLEYIEEYNLSSTNVRNAKSGSESEKQFIKALQAEAKGRSENDEVEAWNFYFDGFDLEEVEQEEEEEQAEQDEASVENEQTTKTENAGSEDTRESPETGNDEKSIKELIDESVTSDTVVQKVLNYVQSKDLSQSQVKEAVSGTFNDATVMRGIKAQAGELEEEDSSDEAQEVESSSNDFQSEETETPEVKEDETIEEDSKSLEESDDVSEPVETTEDTDDETSLEVVENGSTSDTEEATEVVEATDDTEENESTAVEIIEKDTMVIDGDEVAMLPADASDSPYQIDMPGNLNYFQTRHWEEMARRSREVEEQTQAILDDPVVQENSRILRNVGDHLQSLKVSKSQIECPTCGAGSEAIEWTCCGHSLKEAEEKMNEKAQDHMEGYDEKHDDVMKRAEERMEGGE